MWSIQIANITMDMKDISWTFNIDILYKFTQHNLTMNNVISNK